MMAKGYLSVQEIHQTGQNTTLVGKCPLMLVIGSSSSLIRRFADRDMMMRFHVGLGVGHVYVHNQTGHSATGEDREVVDKRLDIGDQQALSEPEEGEAEAEEPVESDMDEYEDSSASEVDETDDDDSNTGDMGDEERLAMDDMYG